MNAILNSPLLAPIVGTIATAIVAGLLRAVQKAILNSHLNAAEKQLATDCASAIADVLDAEAKALPGSKLSAAEVESVALALLKARSPSLLKDAETAALSLLHHENLIQAGGHAELLTASGLSANAPEPVKVS